MLTCSRCHQNIQNANGVKFCMFCGQPLSTNINIPEVTRDLLTQDYVPSEPLRTPNRENDAAPSRVASYRLIRQLGEGGMGRVFEAESDDSGDRVAIKLLSQKLTNSPNSVERFKQEGRLASQISHPRCVFVIGADTDAGQPFIVMELMPGRTLRDIVDTEGTMAPQVAIRYMLDVIDGLIEAHRLDVIHRDVKPSNCFLAEDGRVKIGDFGLSKSLSNVPDQNLTHSGAFLGTILYASPEQIRGEEVGFDSDVYSVCGTLYYLLTGRAPYQHVSLTAALAKAISEPPPPIRKTHPAVPRMLEAIILRGLERDRGRRWGTLEELRDSLSALLPEKLSPATPRQQFAAFLIDSVLLSLTITVPMDVIENVWGIILGPKFGFRGMFQPLPWIGFVLYFGLLEARFGCTLGKWLTGLRVKQVGKIGPPSLGRSLLKSIIFIALMVGVFESHIVLLPLKTVGLFLTTEVTVICFLVLFLKLFRKWQYRGLHDLITGCEVVQRLRPLHAVRLVSQYPNPLESLPPKDPSFPDLIGGFEIRGKLCDLPEGAMLWVADDRGLGRRILIWLRPVSMIKTDDAPIPVRQTRLRVVSSGVLAWNHSEYLWLAFIAPTGAPLADIVETRKQVEWADARGVLEQIVEELSFAEIEGKLPQSYSIDHLWVEPSGRVHLMEFPVPSSSAKQCHLASNPIAFIRQVTTLLLEGKPRTSGGPVRAPLPPHAISLTRKLFTADPSLEELHLELLNSQIHPPRVTTAMRAAHLGILGLMVSPGLVLAYFVTLGFSILLANSVSIEAKIATIVREKLNNPSLVAAWRTNPALATYLKPGQLDDTRQKMDLWILFLNSAAERNRENLSRPERLILDWLEQIELRFEDEFTSSRSLLQLLRDMNNPNNRMQTEFNEFSDQSLHYRRYRAAGQVILGVMLGYSIFAFLFRGGLSMVIAGIALVRRDGRPAGRFQCAIRELLIWLPILLTLWALLAVAAFQPGWMTLRILLSVAAIALLVGYAIASVRMSHRGPHDRLMGTYLVPR